MEALSEFLKKIPKEQHAMVSLLDTLIRKAVPDLSASLKWGNLTYSGKKNVCSLVSHKHHINLQLWNGTGINDPRKIMAGTGKDMRHIKIANKADIDQKYIASIIKQAAILVKE